MGSLFSTPRVAPDPELAKQKAEQERINKEAAADLHHGQGPPEEKQQVRGREALCPASQHPQGPQDCR